MLDFLVIQTELVLSLAQQDRSPKVAPPLVLHALQDLMHQRQEIRNALFALQVLLCEFLVQLVLVKTAQQDISPLEKEIRNALYALLDHMLKISRKLVLFAHMEQQFPLMVQAAQQRKSFHLNHPSLMLTATERFQSSLIMLPLIQSRYG